MIFVCFASSLRSLRETYFKHGCKIIICISNLPSPSLRQAANDIDYQLIDLVILRVFVS